MAIIINECEPEQFVSHPYYIMSDYVAGIIHTLTRSKQSSINVYVVNENVLKDLKKICQVSDDFLSEAFRCLLDALAYKSPVVRLRALGIVDVLFLRSKKFRQLVCESLQLICGYCGLIFVKDCQYKSLVGNIYKQVLPFRCWETIRSWMEKFGDNYPQLIVFMSYYNKTFKNNFEKDRARNKSLEELEQIILKFSLSYNTIKVAIKNILEDYNSYVLTQNIIDDYQVYSDRQANFLDYAAAKAEPDLNASRYRKLMSSSQPSRLVQVLDSMLYSLPNDSSENIEEEAEKGSNNSIELASDGNSVGTLGSKRGLFLDRNGSDDRAPPSKRIAAYCEGDLELVSDGAEFAGCGGGADGTTVASEGSSGHFINIDEEDWIEDFEMTEVSLINAAFDLQNDNLESFKYSKISEDSKLAALKVGKDSTTSLGKDSDTALNNQNAVDLNSKRFEIFQFNFDIDFVKRTKSDLRDSLVSKAVPFLTRWRNTCESIRSNRTKAGKAGSMNKNKVFQSILEILAQVKFLNKLLENI